MRRDDAQEQAALDEHALEPAHLAGCVALAEEANWNQNAADWRLMLGLGRGFGVSAGGRLVATAIALPFERRFGWISMVLVTADHRRRGLATRLMQRAIDALVAMECVPLLDATPAGREVYRRIGFEDCWSLERLQLASDGRPGPAPPAMPGVAVRRIASGDWPEVLAYDGGVFGASRAAILADLARRVPQAALVAVRGGRLCGALFARDGRVATQVGPVVADDAGTALALLATALASVRPPVFIDVPDRHARIGAWLRECGFVLQRPYTRMAYRRSRAFDDPTRLFAIAGPELG